MDLPIFLDTPNNISANRNNGNIIDITIDLAPAPTPTALPLPIFGYVPQYFLLVTNNPK